MQPRIVPFRKIAVRPMSSLHSTSGETGSQGMEVHALFKCLALSVAMLFGGVSLAQAPPPDDTAFRALYKQLVEINPPRSVGSCPQAAQAMRARLLAAGIPAADTQILAPPE